MSPVVANIGIRRLWLVLLSLLLAVTGSTFVCGQSYAQTAETEVNSAADLLKRAEASFEQGLFTEAIADLTEVIRLDPDIAGRGTSGRGH